jgi:hypothetical protein
MIWPATCGETGWKTVFIRFLRPRALRTFRDFEGRPMADRISVIRKYVMTMVAARGRRVLNDLGTIGGGEIAIGRMSTAEQTFGRKCSDEHRVVKSKNISAIRLLWSLVQLP